MLSAWLLLAIFEVLVQLGDDLDAFLRRVLVVEFERHIDLLIAKAFKCKGIFDWWLLAQLACDVSFEQVLLLLVLRKFRDSEIEGYDFRSTFSRGYLD